MLNLIFCLTKCFNVKLLSINLNLIDKKIFRVRDLHLTKRDLQIKTFYKKRKNWLKNIYEIFFWNETNIIDKKKFRKI